MLILPTRRQYRFYEKVVKVKAVVAAILNSFPADHRRPVPTSGRQHFGCSQSGGMRKGGFSGAF